MDFTPDGRLFVCQQGGALRVVKNGTLLDRPFIVLPVDASGERGLLGVAFDPAFTTNSFVYLYYTSKTPAAHNRVSRFTASGDTALAGSETVLLDLDNLSGATNHNGGALHFGTDGKLYIAAGENANSANAQVLTNLLGKILRINPDGSIPADNPFAATATGKNRAIWCYGLRNPFTFAFQPGTGRMFINDVGNSSWEEIDFGAAGVNYGWPATEGYTTNPAYRSPVFAYPHGSGTSAGNAIAGGAFYNPPTGQFPASYLDDYFFGDFVNGWINVMNLADSSVRNFGSGLGSVVDLKVGADGSLFYATQGGIIGRVQYAPTAVRTEPGELPGEFRLEQNYPNPFNPSTTLDYQLAKQGYVSLVVYDLLGRRAAVLDGGFRRAGYYSTTWDASSLASGVYYARFTVTDELGQVKYSTVNKLLMTK
jgi:glucose/arabinose dehydrogenase